MEIRRAFLLEMNVPKNFQPDVALTAALFINRMLCHVLKGKSPLQVLCPMAPLFLVVPKTLGYICFVHIPKYQWDKLEAKAVKC